MSSARWDTELLFPRAMALLEIVCYPPCEAELSCSLISSSFPKLFIFSNRPQEPSAPSPKLFCSKQSCCRGGSGSAEREDLHRSPSPRGVLWAQISPTCTQSLPRTRLCGKGEVFLRGTERFLPEAFRRIPDGSTRLQSRLPSGCKCFLFLPSCESDENVAKAGPSSRAGPLCSSYRVSSSVAGNDAAAVNAHTAACSEGL